MNKDRGANQIIIMYCNVNLRKLLSAHKSHVRETSLFTGAIPKSVRNSQTSRFVSVPGQNPGKVKPKKQRGARVAACDDDGRVMVQEWNRDGYLKEFCFQS